MMKKATPNAPAINASSAGPLPPYHVAKKNGEEHGGEYEAVTHPRIEQQANDNGSSDSSD